MTIENLQQVSDERYTLEFLKEKLLDDLGYNLSIEEPQNNFDWLVNTIYTLRHSQGTYSRLWRNLCTMYKFELETLLDEFTTMDVTFNDNVDVIMWLEG